MSEKPQIYFTSDILEMLRGISYQTYWRRVKQKAALSHLIQKGRCKKYYTQQEKDLIFDNFV